MPACLTHYHFAKNVLARLSQEEGQGIQECPFYWGAQGPDFLFCHRYLPWMKGRDLRDYGDKLHSETKPSQTFLSLRNFLERHKDPAYRSYVLGFVCHYALDSTAHPYVNDLAAHLRKTRPWETQSTMHGEVEAALDAIVLRRETGMLPSEGHLKMMFPKSEGVQRRIAKLYAALLLDLYGEDVPEALVLQATRDAHLVFALLNDRTGLKRQVFQRLERGKPGKITSHLVPITEDDGVDYANIQRQPWGDPPSSQNFFDLMDQAENLALELIRRFQTGDFARLTGERPFG